MGAFNEDFGARNVLTAFQGNKSVPFRVKQKERSTLLSIREDTPLIDLEFCLGEGAMRIQRERIRKEGECHRTGDAK